MKTRSNMPLFVLECDNVKTLSNSQIDLLRCGDYLVKKDASGEHAYKVTFKSDTGMCITYHDASVIETQSYDKVDGNWVYNSEDKTPNLLEVGGTKLYKHIIQFEFEDPDLGSFLFQFTVISTKSTAYTTSDNLEWSGSYSNVVSMTPFYESSNGYYYYPLIFALRGADEQPDCELLLLTVDDTYSDDSPRHYSLAIEDIEITDVVSEL